MGSRVSRGFTREHHEELSSTNDRALQLARDGADRVAVTALAQQQGRGRRGNRWASPPGAGLYASFIVRPRLSAARSPLLTLAGGVAVHDAFAPRLTQPIGLKWPNDVLAGRPPNADASKGADHGAHAGRKLAGILVESATGGEWLDYAVLGVGINLWPAERVEAEGRAVSCAELGGEVDFEAAYAGLAAAIEAVLDRIEVEGLDFVLEAWGRRALGIGRSVSVRRGDALSVGTLLGLARDGGLRLRTATGEETIYTGELRPESLVGG